MKPEDFMLPCMSKQLFGMDCPGCGMQRSLLLVLKGDFADAFFMFPAIYTTILFFVSVGLHFVDKSRNYHKIIVPIAVINALIMIISYIYKQTNL